jgi:cytochrome c-type biogenesis protein CcmE
MKTIHIIIILVLIVSIGVVITTLSDSGQYSDFSESAKNPDKVVHIIGKLNKSKPIEYNAVANANQFSFYLVDDKGIEKKVIYQNTKPQDFEKSENVVVTGSMKGDDFLATSLLLKCPSKYNADKTPSKFGTKQF